MFGDQLPDDPERSSRATRNADALAKMCQDALGGTNSDNEDDAAVAVSPQVTVFVDATPAAATTGGETGLVIEAGPPGRAQHPGSDRL